MQYGNQRGGNGCHPVDGCQDGTPFAGALYKYLAANVFFAGTNNTIFPPYEIKKVGDAKIAFIGLTFEATPTVVTPSGVAGLEFRAEVATDQRARQEAQARAAASRRSSCCCTRAAPRPPPAPAVPEAAPTGDEYTDVNKCVNFNGPEMEDIAAGLDKRIGVIVSAHTHQPYICRMSGKLVTSAASFGRRRDRHRPHDRHEVASKITGASADEQDRHAGRRQGPGRQGDPRQVHDARRRRSPTGSSARSRADILSARDTPSGQNAAGEQPMGDVIADAMLEATTPSDFGGAVAAFMNSGGVRAEPARSTRSAAASSRARSPTARRSPSSRSATRSWSRPARASRSTTCSTSSSTTRRRVRTGSCCRRRTSATRGRDAHAAGGRRHRVRSTAAAVDKAASYRRRHEQLHGGRRRRLHRVHAAAPSRSAARSTSTRSRATSAKHAAWRPPALNRITQVG